MPDESVRGARRTEPEVEQLLEPFPREQLAALPLACRRPCRWRRAQPPRAAPRASGAWPRSSRARPTSSRSLSGHRRPDRPVAPADRSRASCPRGRQPPPHGSSLSSDRVRKRHVIVPAALAIAPQLRGTSSVPDQWARGSTGRRAGRTKTVSPVASPTHDNHPTGVACEEALGALDGGRALLFPSGMGAVTTVLLTLARPGHTIAVAEAAYYGHTQVVLHLAPWGLDCVGGSTRAGHLRRGRPGAHRVAGEPDADDARLRGGRRAPGTRGLRRDGGLTTPRAAARPWVRHRPALRDQGARRPRRRCSHGVATTARMSRPARASPSDATAHRDGRLAGCRLAAPPRAAHPRRSSPSAAGDHGTPARRAPRRRPGGETSALPGLTFLISFDVADADAAGRVERAVRVIENATSLGAVRSKLGVAPPLGGR